MYAYIIKLKVEPWGEKDGEWRNKGPQSDANQAHCGSFSATPRPPGHTCIMIIYVDYTAFQETFTQKWT